MDGDKDEKLDLLVEAHGIDDSVAHVCCALSKQICRCMLHKRTADNSKHLEGLCLKVQLEKGHGCKTRGRELVPRSLCSDDTRWCKMIGAPSEVESNSMAMKSDDVVCLLIENDF